MGLWLRKTGQAILSLSSALREAGKDAPGASEAYPSLWGTFGAPDDHVGALLADRFLSLADPVHGAGSPWSLAAHRSMPLSDMDRPTITP